MNEPIFALLLFASLSLLDSFFPSGLVLTKISLSTTLHVPFHSILALKFQGTGMILIHSSRNRHLKKITPNGNASYVFLKSLSDCHCQSTQRRISCNTFFFPEVYLWSSNWSSTEAFRSFCSTITFIALSLFSIVRDVPPNRAPKNPDFFGLSLSRVQLFLHARSHQGHHFHHFGGALGGTGGAGGAGAPGFAAAERWSSSCFLI